MARREPALKPMRKLDWSLIEDAMEFILAGEWPWEDQQRERFESTLAKVVARKWRAK